MKRIIFSAVVVLLAAAFTLVNGEDKGSAKSQASVTKAKKDCCMEMGKSEAGATESGSKNAEECMSLTSNPAHSTGKDHCEDVAGKTDCCDPAKASKASVQKAGLKSDCCQKGMKAENAKPSTTKKKSE